jgi:hypothetical protein
MDERATTALIEQSLLQAAHTVEQQLDAEIHKLENLDEGDLESIRRKRMDELKRCVDLNVGKAVDRPSPGVVRSPVCTSLVYCCISFVGLYSKMDVWNEVIRVLSWFSAHVSVGQSVRATAIADGKPSSRSAVTRRTGTRG